VIAVVIPSRMSSKRLPGKAMADIHGKSLIQRVYEGCGTEYPVYVATPDEAIYDLVTEFGGLAVLTGPSETMHGRVVEANKTIGVGIVVLVQGDEPMVSPRMVKQALTGMYDAGVSMLVRRKTIKEDGPESIKVIVDSDNEVRYITRSLAPGAQYKAIGVKAFAASVLEKFPLLPVTPEEAGEGIEELRFIMNGCPIRAVKTSHQALSVDTIKDLEKVRVAWKTK